MAPLPHRRVSILAETASALPRSTARRRRRPAVAFGGLWLLILSCLALAPVTASAQATIPCTSNAECDDANTCTDDYCDQVSQTCVYLLLNESCDDGNACTSNDFCVARQCVGGDLVGGCSACDGAAWIPDEGGTVVGTTSGFDFMADTCGVTGGSPDRVYAWTPASSGTATIETCGSPTDFDTVLELRSGDCLSGSSVACNNDTVGCGPGETGSFITTSVSMGQTYYIIVDGAGGAAGTYRLTVSAPAACGNDIAEPGEECDGTDASMCLSGQCNTGGAPCTCVPDAGGQPDIYPEVTGISVVFNTSVDPEDVVEGCASQASGVDILKFTTNSWNIGTDDIHLGDPQCPNCNDPANDFAVCGNPAYYCAPASGHSHEHYQNFAYYDLLDANGQSMVAAGNKKGFCLRDSFCLPSGNPVYDCSNQGISVDCGDRYSSGLGCNFVEVTDVPSGDYLLRVRMDPYDIFAELDESNNGVVIPVTIPPRGVTGSATPIPSAGGTFSGVTSGTSGATASCDASTGTSPEEIFEWIPSVSGSAIIDTCSAATLFDTVLSARGGTIDGLELTCEDDTPGCAVSDGSATDHGSVIGVPITAGVPVYIFIDGDDGEGAFEFNVTPIPAMVLPPGGGVFADATSGASAFGASCAGATAATAENVYEWTPDISGLARVETCSPNTVLDTVLYVREGSTDGTEVGCNDDTQGCGVSDGSANADRHGSVVEWNVTAGETYFLYADAYTGEGTIELTLTPATATCGDGIAEGGEQCDGADDASCPGACQSDCTCSALTVDTVSLQPARDNTLYESSVSDPSNGSGEYVFAGLTGAVERRRAVLAFDIAGSIPAGSVIESVTLDLNMSRTIAGNTDVSLHRVTGDWGEGASDAPGEEGGGDTPASNDATWLYRFYDPADPTASPAWSAPGGDFAPSASATTAVASLGTYSWSSPAMAQDLQSWLDAPTGNFGWIVIGGETPGPVTAKRFDSREHSNPANRPTLHVSFTPPAGSGACCATDGSCTRTPDAASCSGVFQGDDVFCAVNPCVQPTGACCLPDDSCSDGLTQAQCNAQAGGHQGAGSTCAAAQCGGPGGSVPTDIQLPGTQPEDAHDGLLPSTACSQCHSDFPQQDLEGSMMAHAGRDPVFWAALAVAEQDFKGSGDLCLRCHAPKGWLAGRSLPTDGSALLDGENGDTDGISCDLCHRLTNPALTSGPQPVGVQNAPFLANDGGAPATAYSGSGMYVITSNSSKLGPYADAVAPHTTSQSDFHRSSDLCGTCHDVSNPLVGDLAPNHGAQTPLAAGTFSGVPGAPVDGKAAFNNFPYQYGIVERTFSEAQASLLSTTLVDDYTSLPSELQNGAIESAYLAASPSGPGYEDGTPRTFSCQTCHMRPSTGQGCNQNPPTRTDLPTHDLTGGNYWVPDAIQYLDGLGKLRLGGGLTPQQASNLNAGKLRAKQNLSEAAGLSVNGNQLRVVNLTGHKLITGYPEGRRMWVQVEWYDSGNALLAEDGAYGTIMADIDGTPTPVETILDLDDPYAKVYEAHKAITQDWAVELLALGTDPNLPLEYDRTTGAVLKTLGQLASDPPGTYYESFHFVLNNYLSKDTRIPPYGMTYDAAVERNLIPVPSAQYGDPDPGGTYDHWDDFTLNPPPGADHATITLLYQPTSWEYIQFLHLANDGQNAFLGGEGDDLLEAWLNTGMAAPHAMSTTTWTAALPACNDGLDNDGDGLFDLLDPGCADVADESENSVCDARDGVNPCDNGIFCDGVEICDEVQGCLAGAPPSCDDGLACTIDSCNVGTDSCDNIDDGSCPVCGNDLTEAGEACDGSDDAACPGLCQSDCSCAPPPPVCGNDLLESGEQCDGSDDAACPGLCNLACACSTSGFPLIPAAGGVVSGTTSGASQYSSQSCSNSGSSDAPEHVYEWTAATSGNVSIQTCSPNTTFDTVMYVREGAPTNPSVFCNDDTSGCAVNDGSSNAGRHGSQIQFAAVAGQTYFFFVDGYRAFGDYELSVTPVDGAVCGDGVSEGTEACDGTDDAACPGLCQSDCTCGSPPAVCGNDVTESGESCDGTDDTLCPGACQSDCSCPPVCGNGLLEGLEVCDGSDDAACPGLCLSDCSCAPPPVCGNDLSEPGEQCDGSDDAACPGLCDAGCACPVPGVIVFPSAGGVLGGTTSGVSEYSSQACSNSASSDTPEQAFEWTAAASGTVTIQTCSQNTLFDTILYARAGDIASPTIACNDDTPGCGVNDGSSNSDRHGSSITFQAVVNETYYFFVDGYRESGDFEVSVTPVSGAVCGDGVTEGTEACDGADDTACPGLCQSDCSCGSPPAVCGNAVQEGGEACDGTDDAACPGACQSDCSCPPPPPVCGNGVLESGEICDGGDDDACPGLCQSDCSCAPPPVCGNDLSEIGEQCDGSDDAACPGLCDAGCTCPVPGVIVFPSAGGVLGGTTSGLSEYSSLACSNSATADTPEQVFEWTATAAGPVTVETCSQNTLFDTILYARAGGVGSPTIACNDDTAGCGVNDGSSSANRHGSSITFNAVVNETYYFFVDGYRESGDFELSVTPTSGAVCGDGVTEGTEACDGADDAACPGLCQSDCSCGTPPPVCGNDVLESGEACDGSDDAACPGACQSDCSCPPPPPVCGNDVLESGETCDGGDDAACPGLCQSDCSCAPPPVCGNDVAEIGEPCDGADASACATGTCYAPGSVEGTPCTCVPPPPGSAPVFEAGASAEMSPNGTSFDIAYPAGVSTGDELLIWVGTDGDPAGVSCTNFERLLHQNENGTVQLSVFRRRATGPHTGFETCSWDPGEAQQGGLVMTRVSNAGRLRPPMGSYTPSSSIGDPPAIPIPSADALVLTACAHDGTANSVSDPPAGYLELFDGVGADTSGANISLASRTLTTTGSEDPGPFTNWSRIDGSACVTLAYDNGSAVEPVFSHDFDDSAGNCELESAYKAHPNTDCDCTSGACASTLQGGEALLLPSVTTADSTDILFRERFADIPDSGCFVMDFEMNISALGTGNSTFLDFFNGLSTNTGPSMRYLAPPYGVMGMRCGDQAALSSTFNPQQGVNYKARLEYCYDSGPGNCPGNPANCEDCGCLYMDTTADYGTTVVDECDENATTLPINGFSFSPGNNNLDLVIDDIGICPTLPAPGEKCGE